jgi:hypothetical protein
MAVTSSTHFHLSPRFSKDEHLVMLMSARRFDRLLLKDDFLDEGVAAVFGLAGEEVELLGLSFHAGKFTTTQVAEWLAERRLTPSVDVESDSWITHNNQSPCVVTNG